jgi:hypothetical protein
MQSYRVTQDIVNVAVSWGLVARSRPTIAIRDLFPVAVVASLAMAASACRAADEHGSDPFCTGGEQNDPSIGAKF